MKLPRPEIEQLKIRPFPAYEQMELSNGARLIIIREPGWKVFRLEACFLAGRPYEHKRSVAKSTAQLLKEGSRRYSSLELAEQLESKGASLKSKASIDTAHVIMHAPVSQFESLFPIFHEIVTDPGFSEKELEKYKKSQINKLDADLSINEVVAYRNFTEGLFGTQHPYGYNSRPEDYKNLRKEDLKKHYQDAYAPENALFLLSGGIHTGMIEKIVSGLEDWENPFSAKTVKMPKEQAQSGLKVYEKGNRYQASIRMGSLMFPYEHPDFPDAQIANTLLGGFFGSRLMRKVRQEKGLAYNIFSVLEPMRYSGYWMVGTETGVSNVDEVITLIREEMQKLAENRIRKEEMDMMRNYLIGNSLQYFEGAFNKSDFLRHHLFEVADPGLYDRMMTSIAEMDAEKIRSAAERHFRAENLFTVVVR